MDSRWSSNSNVPISSLFSQHVPREKCIDHPRLIDIQYFISCSFVAIQSLQETFPLQVTMLDCFINEGRRAVKDTNKVLRAAAGRMGRYLECGRKNKR
ncbi:hypothetical protein WN48_09713 [Eufriesea mexicana]|uniref:Uncharacterized protein n=1 Tax=Eufriesea mexicana TaxID=516756 RepID=A0A310SJK7_9HYME|nr:hypothetical protein WN48_09713 [Eufriesea mexicana]